MSMHSGSYDNYLAVMKTELEDAPGANQKVQLWLEDTAFVLDELTSQNGTLASLAEVVDADQLGIFGMSLGGATAAKFCQVEPRCVAGLNMDGFQYGHNAIDMKLNRPFMMINADRRDEFSAILGAEVKPDQLLKFEMNDFMLRQSQAVSYNLVIAGANHGSFSDFLVQSQNIGSWTGLADIDPWQMKGFLDDYVLAFFEQHLKGHNQPLLYRPSSAHPGLLKFEVLDPAKQLSRRAETQRIGI